MFYLHTNDCEVYIPVKILFFCFLFWYNLFVWKESHLVRSLHCLKFIVKTLNIRGWVLHLWTSRRYTKLYSLFLCVSYAQLLFTTYFEGSCARGYAIYKEVVCLKQDLHWYGVTTSLKSAMGTQLPWGCMWTNDLCVGTQLTLQLESLTTSNFLYIKS